MQLLEEVTDKMSNVSDFLHLTSALLNGIVNKYLPYCAHCLTWIRDGTEMIQVLSSAHPTQTNLVKFDALVCPVTDNIQSLYCHIIVW